MSRSDKPFSLAGLNGSGRTWWLPASALGSGIATSVLSAPALGALALEKLVQVVEHRTRSREARLVLAVRHRDRIDELRESGRLRPAVRVHLQVDVVDRLGDRPQRRIGNLEAAEQYFERAQLALVRVFAVEHVEAQLARLVPVLARAHELELRVGIDEAADEPGASHPVDVDAGPRDPRPSARPLRDFCLLLGLRLGSSKTLRELLQQALDGFTGAAVEEVDCGDIPDPLLQADQRRLELSPLLVRHVTLLRQEARELPRLAGDLLVIGVARRSEHLLHRLVAQPFDESGLDEGSIASALHDLAKHPVQVLVRLLAGR